MKLLRSAGGIVWRDSADGPRIAVVHRTCRDDWSLPKGKVEPGEGWAEAARRELAEETGWAVRLERFAGAKLQADRPEPKLVLYWHARALEPGVLPDVDEIDDVAWLSRRAALARLDSGSDRALLLRSMPTGARGAPALAPDDLRRLVVLDSRRAAELLPEALSVIARAVARDGARPHAARRA